MIVTIRSGRNPFQLWMLSACVLSGIVGLLTPGANTNSAINRLLPGWETEAWYISLALFGLIGLIGSARNNLLVERVGMAALSAVALLYAIGVVAAAGTRGAFAALLVAAFAAACVTRYVQINRDLRVLARAATRSLDPDGG